MKAIVTRLRATQSNMERSPAVFWARGPLTTPHVMRKVAMPFVKWKIAASMPMR